MNTQLDFKITKKAYDSFLRVILPKTDMSEVVASRGAPFMAYKKSLQSGFDYVAERLQEVKDFFDKDVK